VLLLGMMGSGKTSVGHALQARTGWPYRDNDELVASITGLDTRTLLDERGEKALREAESRALQLATTSPPPLVAGIAGGVVVSAEDRAALRDSDALVVYLHAPVDLLVARVGDGAGRPWLQPNPRAALQRLYDGREPLYREVADLVVEVGEGTPDDHAAAVLESLRNRAVPGHDIDEQP
jgi:shikimate kinase